MLATRYLCLVSVSPQQVRRVDVIALAKLNPDFKGAVLPRAFRNTKLPANLAAAGLPVKWLPAAARGEFYGPIIDAMHGVMVHSHPCLLVQTPAAAQVIADRFSRTDKVYVPQNQPSVWVVQPNRQYHTAEYSFARVPGLVRSMRLQSVNKAPSSRPR